jgi:hypothetical protein
MTLQWHLLRRTLALFFALIQFVVWGSSASAQVDQWGFWENGVTESWWLSSEDFTNEEANEVSAHWKRIGGELQSASVHRWAGDYFEGGETHGTYVRWSPQEGFVIAHIDKCQAKVMGVAYGRVQVTPTLIHFYSEFSKGSQKSHGHSHSPSQESDGAVISFVLIKWRGSLLLVPEGEISDFSDYVSGLGDFNGLIGFAGFDLESSYFLSKAAGKDQAAGEIPIVPAQYERFMKKPITATITAVNGRRLKRNYSYQHSSKLMSFASQYELASLTYVAVNVGIANGMKPGLFLRVSTPDLGESVRLLQVGEISSRGVVVRDVQHGRETYYSNESERELSYPRVAVGWKLTTAQRR